MPFSVVYDACVLHPVSLRDLLIRLSLERIVQARWSDEILTECFASILTRNPMLDSGKLTRTRALMCDAIPSAMVTGHGSLTDSLTLPDPRDRHVLAAAICSGSQAIVTFNLRDFPASALAVFNIEAKHPDEFVLNCIDIAPAVVIRVITEQADSYANPAHTVSELLTVLRRAGLVQSVARLNELHTSLLPPGF
jgi:hypothetical protein